MCLPCADSISPFPINQKKTTLKMGDKYIINLVIVSMNLITVALYSS